MFRVALGLLRCLLALGSLAVAGVAGAALLGFAVPQFDLLNHFQLLIFIGSAAGLAVTAALFARSRWQRWVVGLAAIGFLASGATFLPEAAWGLLPRPGLPSDGRPVYRLMTHNLFGRNLDMQTVRSEIRRQQADIVAFQEYMPPQRRRLRELLENDFPYRAECNRGIRGHLAIYSRFPLTAAMEGACVDNAPSGINEGRIVARISPPGAAPFTLATTHIDWPAPIQRQREQFDRLAARLQRESGPLLLVGDFNSTPWSYALRQFTATAGLDRQTRNLPSFPELFSIRGWRRTPSILPLDHVMTRGEVAVHEVHLGKFTGSDHLPVIATFSVGGAAPVPAGRLRR